MTPEDLVYDAPVPEWARGAEVREGALNENCDDTYDLYCNDRHVGCMYDDGPGYIFAQWARTRDLEGACGLA